MSTITYGVVAENYSLNGTARSAFGIVAYADAEEDTARQQSLHRHTTSLMTAPALSNSPKNVTEEILRSVILMMSSKISSQNKKA